MIKISNEPNQKIELKSSNQLKKDHHFPRKLNQIKQPQTPSLNQPRSKFKKVIPVVILKIQK